LDLTRQLSTYPPTNVLVVSNTGIAFDHNGEPVIYATNQAGAETGFILSILPANAGSFSFLDFREVRGLATNIAGCFTNANVYTNTTDTNPIPGLINIGHTTADNWWFTEDDNLFGDSVWSPSIPPPYSPGSFQWIIPNQFKVRPSGDPSNFLVTTETFEVDTNGTVTITKFGQHVRRETNGSSTNW
jgi:hypothetical protein